MPRGAKKLPDIFNKDVLGKVIVILILIVLVECAFFLFSATSNKSSSSEDRARINAQEIFKKCDIQGSREQCYAKEFYSFTKKNPIKHSISVLEQLQNIDPANSLGCHFISHKISQAETEKDPKKWQEIIKEINFYMCTGGFLHGVIEAHLATDSDFKINKDSANLICNEIVNDNSSGERSCNHIMGHLLLAQFNGDQRKAVEECETFPEYIPKYECLSGAFMENLTREYLVAHGIAARFPWNPENAKIVEKRCAEYDGDAEKACWKEISYLYWSINKTDEKKLLGACNNAPTQEARDECFLYGVGNMIHSFQFKPERLPYICDVYDPSDDKYTRCNWQLIGSLLNNSLKDVSEAINICQKININSRNDCFDRIIDILSKQNAPADYINKVCTSAPKEFLSNYCRGLNEN